MILLRIHTRYVRPAVARILTRLILLAVDILAVWQLFLPYDPNHDNIRLWPVWAAFGTTLIASFTAMRTATDSSSGQQPEGTMQQPINNIDGPASPVRGVGGLSGRKIG